MLATERLGTEGFVEGDPEVAFLVDAGSESILVVVATETPVIADRLDHICTAIAILIAQPTQLTALDGVEPVVVPLETQRFLETIAEEGEFWRFTVGVLYLPDVAAAGADVDDSFTGTGHQTADFQKDPFRSRNVDHLVVLRFVVQDRFVEGRLQHRRRQDQKNQCWKNHHCTSTSTTVPGAEIGTRISFLPSTS